jgi:hypothetical protein
MLGSMRPRDTDMTDLDARKIDKGAWEGELAGNLFGCENLVDSNSFGEKRIEDFPKRSVTTPKKRLLCLSAEFPEFLVSHTTLGYSS